MSATVGVLGRPHLSQRQSTTVEVGHRAGRSPETIARHPGVHVVRFDWAGGNRMRSVSFLQRFLAVAIFVLVTASTALSQSDRGTIAGTVLDSSGGAVAGAQVTATGEQTGTVYTATSGPTGGFRIAEIRIGVYRVTVAAAGFKAEDKTGVVVQVNSTASLEYSLQPGDVKETLTVIADAPTLQAESSEIGTVVSTRQIEELPLSLNATGQSFLRSVQAFVFLTPGTAGPGTNSDSASSGIFESKISGGQNFST